MLVLSASTAPYLNEEVRKDMRAILQHMDDLKSGEDQEAKEKAKKFLRKSSSKSLFKASRTKTENLKEMDERERIRLKSKRHEGGIDVENPDKGDNNDEKAAQTEVVRNVFRKGTLLPWVRYLGEECGVKGGQARHLVRSKGFYLGGLLRREKNEQSSSSLGTRVTSLLALLRGKLMAEGGGAHHVLTLVNLDFANKEDLHQVLLRCINSSSEGGGSSEWDGCLTTDGYLTEEFLDLVWDALGKN